MSIDELLSNLQTDAEWAEGNEWEAPLGLYEDLMEAIEIITRLRGDAT